MIGFSLNGVIESGSELRINLHEPFFAHGEGLFETLRLHEGQPVFLGAHVDRMRSAAKELQLPCNVDQQYASRAIQQLADRFQLTEARIKLHLLVTCDLSTDILITAEQAPPFHELGPAESVGICADQFNGGQTMNGLKTMNYMVNRLADREGRSRGFDEVLFTLPDGTVLEGSRSTVFVVREQTLVTPPIDLGILPGVTRGVVLDVAQELGLDVAIEGFKVPELQSSAEAFLTGSVSGVRPIDQVEGSRFSPVPGGVTQRIAQGYTQRIHQEL